MFLQPVFAQAAACNAHLDTLEAQFGSVIASRILEAEAADFHWSARIRERYLGQYLDDGFGSGEELARIMILSELGNQWHVGVCLVDGEGAVDTLLWLRSYAAYEEACDKFERAH
jgi:hypothetical protein